jgi:hypothetical protein
MAAKMSAEMTLATRQIRKGLQRERTYSSDWKRYEVRKRMADRSEPQPPK